MTPNLGILDFRPGIFMVIKRKIKVSVGNVKLSFKVGVAHPNTHFTIRGTGLGRVVLSFLSLEETKMMLVRWVWRPEGLRLQKEKIRRYFSFLFSS